MAFCSGCGTQIADGTTMCPACSSRTAAPPAAAVGTTGGMTDNVVGMLCYITIIPAIIFLVMEPYNKSRFVRFHAFQMIFFSVAMIVIWIGLTVIGFRSGIDLRYLPVTHDSVARIFYHLDHPFDQSQSRPDVQATCDWRPSREAG